MALVALPTSQALADDHEFGGPGPADPDSGLSGPFNVGTLRTCSDVRTMDDDGNFVGGTAGFTANSEGGCHSGGGETFCAEYSSFEYECAGASLFNTEDGAYDLEWAAFDPPEGEDASEYAFTTTRNENRGRAGNDMPLFMNEHGVCRMIDKTETGGGAALATDPIFIGVATEAEWRSFHREEAGAPPASQPNTAPNLDQVPMEVCCAPAIITICGAALGTGYAPEGVQVVLYNGFASARATCVDNNEWRIDSVEGVCGWEGRGDTGGGGVGGQSDGGPMGGVSNPDTGGQISADDFSGMSAEAQAGLSDAGYSNDPSVDSTNAEGQAAAEAAEAEAEAQAAEAAAAEAAAEADADSDDGGDDGGPGGPGT